jgi:hypothetical protein
VKAREVSSHRLRKYGLTADDYWAMVEAQAGVCAICGQVESTTRRGEVKTLAVDHDHTTGAVRGLLCNRCNTGIGLLGDNPATLAAAIRYLNSHRTT